MFDLLRHIISVFAIYVKYFLFLWRFLYIISIHFQFFPAYAFSGSDGHGYGMAAMRIYRNFMYLRISHRTRRCSRPRHTAGRSGRDHIGFVYGRIHVPLDRSRQTDGGCGNHRTSLKIVCAAAAPHFSINQDRPRAGASALRKHLRKFPRTRKCRHAYGHPSRTTDGSVCIHANRHRSNVPARGAQYRLHSVDPRHCGRGTVKPWLHYPL